MGLIERYSGKNGKVEKKQRTGGTFGYMAFCCSKICYVCTGGWQFRALLIVTILCTQCETEKKPASITLLFLEIDCFNLEVNKHHACSQHPNPELLEIGTLELPPTGK